MAALSGVREMSMTRDNAMNVALQLGAVSLQIVLLRCTTCCCDVAALQLAWLRCYGATTRMATLLQCYSSRGYVCRNPTLGEMGG